VEINFVEVTEPRDIDEALATSCHKRRNRNEPFKKKLRAWKIKGLGKSPIYRQANAA